MFSLAILGKEKLPFKLVLCYKVGGDWTDGCWIGRNNGIKLYTSSKRGRQERRCLELHDLNLDVSKVFLQRFDILIWFLFHWQQQKSKQIHAWALEIPIMSLHLIFQEKKKVSAQHTSTYLAPNSRYASLCSASPSQLSRQLARQLLFARRDLRVLRHARTTPFHIHTGRLGGGIL